MKVVLTGANGFLGWHTRTVLFEMQSTVEILTLGLKFNLNSAVEKLNGADLLIHLAGANRGREEEISGLNKLFATQISNALLSCKSPPKAVVYSNSIQAGNGTVYGESKQSAATILEKTAKSIDAQFKNVLIPNVFGEHGKPFYNSVTATFCHQIANAETPTVNSDSQLTLVHAQDVAEYLTGFQEFETFNKTFVTTDVSKLLNSINHLANTYIAGEIPEFNSPFEKNLFNTYRSHLFYVRPVIDLKQNTDERGDFVEIVRSSSGGGQASFSTTLPGVTRGEHFHRRKIERFSVVSGSGTISLRKMFSNEVFSFEVTGEKPQAIDMPTLWAHNITNTSNELLLTSFWINEPYDALRPDTIFEKVGNQNE